MVVLITKGEGDYRVIGLVVVVWKVVAKIINCRLIASVAYHSFLR